MHGVSVISAFARFKERLSKHRYLSRVRHVEDREDRALSVLNKLIEGFRLQDLLHPIDCLYHPASAKDFVTSVGVDDSFAHHPHDNLQIGPADSDYSQVPENGLRHPSATGYQLAMTPAWLSPQNRSLFVPGALPPAPIHNCG
jgi:hypothetical protein